MTDSILQSITRDTVLRIAKDELGMKVSERSIDRSEVYICDEAFFCGSAVEISPISKIDGFTVGEGKPGKHTIKIHEKYLEIATGKIINYRNWNTPIYVKGE